MRLIASITLTALATVATTSLAQPNEVGNGGNALVCDGPFLPLLRVLDVAEGQMAGEDYTLELSREGRQAIVGQIADRLERLDPTRAAELRAKGLAFETNYDLVQGPLEALSDIGSYSPPEGCHVEQLAVRREQIFPDTHFFHYTIDRDLWDGLSEFNRAALIVHEIVYEEATWTGQTNAVRSRRFTRRLLSDELRTATPAQYQQWLGEALFVDVVHVEGHDFARDAALDTRSPIELRGRLRYDTRFQIAQWPSSAYIVVKAGTLASFYRGDMLTPSTPSRPLMPKDVTVAEAATLPMDRSPSLCVVDPGMRLHLGVSGRVTDCPGFVTSER